MDTNNSESPQYVRMSLAAAITLGFRRGRFYRNAKLHCINLLLTYRDGCKANCAYCGLSRERQLRKQRRTFIRVEWPAHRLEEVIARMEANAHRVQRICISMITHRRAVSDVKAVTTAIRQRLSTPISLLITPSILKGTDVEEFKALGADKVGIAIDAATPEIFARLRTPHWWEIYWAIFREAINVFGSGQVGVHLIVGLGETEEEMVRTMQRVHDQGGSTHLFSFFPEVGSLLQDHQPSPIGRYRRVQLARFLIDIGLSSYDRFDFDKRGRLLNFGLPHDNLDRIIASGEPFITSGCSGANGNVACNRPYGNCLPGTEIRNYPFQPEARDIEDIKKQLYQY